MNADRYEYRTNVGYFDFEFKSLGPKGTIIKVARFTEIGTNIYNFGFGDLDPESGEISDTIISNNGDGDKVLQTVGKIIYDFTAIYPNALIFVQGSTPSRTRWYQMNINKYWHELEPVFEIFGYRDIRWEHFRKGFNYEAFLGRRKTSFL